jgi:phage antirepressor YoqD-like protein
MRLEYDWHFYFIIMNELMNISENENNGNRKMSSVQLVEIINEYRKSEGNNSMLRHSDFLQKIEKELNGDERNFSSTYLDKSNRQAKCYLLPKDECILMLMSESRIVRKGVLQKLNELENNSKHNIPQTFSEALKLAGEQAEQIEKQQLLIAEQTPKVVAFENVIDNANTYTLDSVSDILDIGRTTLCKLLERKKWKTIKETHGTSSTRFAEESGYAKTIYEYIKINNNDIKTKRFVLKKKGLEKLISEFNKQ